MNTEMDDLIRNLLSGLNRTNEDEKDKRELHAKIASFIKLLNRLNKETARFAAEATTFVDLDSLSDNPGEFIKATAVAYSKYTELADALVNKIANRNAPKSDA